MDAPAAADAPAVLRVGRPDPALTPYVRSYLGVEQRGAETVAVGALPSAVLTVTWGGKVEALTGRSTAGRPYPLVALSGPLTVGHRVEVGAGARGFHVRLGPTGARALLGERAPADDWDGGLPAAVERWAEAVAGAASFEARVALADAFLLGRLPARGVWSDAAVGLVVRSAGALPVVALAAALGASERTLRRRFDDDVGLGPKAFAQVERYRQAHGFLLRTPGATWRDVCERYGYCDQSHFDRAFRRFTGQPPTRWLEAAHGLDLGMGLREDGA